MIESLKRHWPEYLMEAAGLATFMISACVFGTLIGHPASPVRQAISNPIARRALMGMAMGLTAIGIIYSPWGKQSGAHLNPSVTLTYLRCGKIARPDAAFYISAQFAGAVAGVALAAAVIGPRLANPDVNYVATIPMAGTGAAFAAEAAISFLLMSVVLRVSNHPQWNRLTGLFAGALLAGYITFESPISGMSMNPARSLGSALPAAAWHPLWIYFLAPPLGMQLAAALYRRGHARILCAKLHHANSKRCIFRCSFPIGEDHAVQHSL
jgi:aquaporin Z